MVRRRMVTACGAVALLVAGCGGSDDGASSSSSTPARTDNRKPPEAGAVLAALAPLPGGALRAGELTTGVVRDVLTRGGRRATGGAARTLVKLSVSTGGQRGLVGLAVDGQGRTFASFTTTGKGERLVVEQVLPGPRRRVWTGPESTDLADGGHIAFDGNARLIIGIGDLQDPKLTPREDTPNGKLLSLDPDGPADQEPRILSRGWNNPYAFAPLESAGRAALLVADNAPGERPERIARGDADGGAPRAVTELKQRIAPSGLAVLDKDEIAVCGVRSGELTRFRRRDGRWRQAGQAIAPCAFGVTRLTDGRLAASTADGVSVVEP